MQNFTWTSRTDLADFPAKYNIASRFWIVANKYKVIATMVIGPPRRLKIFGSVISGRWYGYLEIAVRLFVASVHTQHPDVAIKKPQHIGIMRWDLNICSKLNIIAWYYFVTQYYVLCTVSKASQRVLKCAPFDRFSMSPDRSAEICKEDRSTLVWGVWGHSGSGTGRSP